jgi:DNA-binding PadR family transcriptional regulator
MTAHDDETLRAALPLSPAVFQILLALADGALHGYAIMQEVEERTGGEFTLGAGTLYGAIRRLREQGLIEERTTEAEESESRRRTYELTVPGRRLAVLESERLASLVHAARAKRLIGRPA